MSDDKGFSFDLDLDAEGSASPYPPFRVKVGGQVFSADPPDAGLVMEIEEARTTRVVLALAFDKEWKDLEPLLARKGPDLLLTLVRQYGEHFDLDQAGMVTTATPSRAERRRRRPRI